MANGTRCGAFAIKVDIQTTLKRNPGLLAVDMDGETVMMDMENGNYFGINAVGSHIGETLENENKAQSLRV